MWRPAGPGRDASIISRPLNRIAAQPARVDKADGSDSGRVMAALSDAAVIDVTAADQSRVKVGCRTRGNHVKMPWQRAACSGLKCANPLWVACPPGCRVQMLTPLAAWTTWPPHRASPGLGHHHHYWRILAGGESAAR
jgi:hypothetical protein